MGRAGDADMTEQTQSRLPTIGLWLSIYMIAIFLWRFFVPAHEYDAHSVRYLEMTLDALATFGLAAIFVRSFGAPNPNMLRTLLLWGALVSAAGIWLIRFSSDDSWATGHRLYWLTPR